MEQFYNKSPFITLISFHKLIESLEDIALSHIDYRANYAKSLLQQIAGIPELRTGIKDLHLIKDNEELIGYLLADLFPTALTHNEIKAVTIPFQNFTFNYTQRFQKILSEAGIDFDMTIRDFDEHQFYIMNCCIILNTYFGQDIQFSYPLFYDIPDKNGIIKHYRILYNADFMEVSPTEKAKQLTIDDIDLLMSNYDDLELWKEKFPEGSWLLKGFGILSLYDATTESSISSFKTNLLRNENKQDKVPDSFENIFRSIFKIPDLKAGFTVYNEEENIFTKLPFDESKVSSFILTNKKEADCKSSLGNGCLFESLIEEKKPFVIASVENFAKLIDNKRIGDHFLMQDIQSCILAPVVKDNKLLGIIELASATPNALNGINAKMLDLVMPYLVDTLDRFNIDMQNQIEAIIQREYTTIHPSVYWKFRNEAKKYFQTATTVKDYIFKEITFKDVYPLYGQIDVKGSSEHRNEAIKNDLKNQLTHLISVFDSLHTKNDLLVVDQKKFELQSLLQDLEHSLKADTEQFVQKYIETEIHPLLKNAMSFGSNTLLINGYFENLDEKTGLFYHSRKRFDSALSILNKRLAAVLDKKQIKAQQIFPHYYERFKSDGVEHNLYIGASIAPNENFDMMYLHNLRLWQLQTLCEMEMEHHSLKASLPYNLEVTSLLLVSSSPISIRFRMDEKRFDVDGTYNARYEVVKKRIDKALIKGKTDRITEKEKITIVYSHQQEETEYLKYIKFLQHRNILDVQIEKFDVEDLQGISGLKAMRVKVVNHNTPNKLYSYQDLLDELL